MSNDWNPVLLGPRTSSPSNDSSQIDGREILPLAPGGKGWNCREITRSPTRYCDQEIRNILAQRFDQVVKSKKFTDELKKFRTNQGLNGQEVDLTVVLTKTRVKVVYDGKTHTLIKDWGSPKTIKKANAIYEAHKYHFCGQCDHAHSRTSSTASSHSNDHHEEPQPPHHPSSSYSDHNSEHSYDAYSHASSSPSPRPPQTPTSYSFDTSYPDDHYSYSKTTSQLPNDTTSSNHSGSPTNSDTSSDGEAVAALMSSEATPPLVYENPQDSLPLHKFTSALNSLGKWKFNLPPQPPTLRPRDPMHSRYDNTLKTFNRAATPTSPRPDTPKSPPPQPPHSKQKQPSILPHQQLRLESPTFFDHALENGPVRFRLSPFSERAQQDANSSSSSPDDQDSPNSLHNKEWGREPSLHKPPGEVGPSDITQFLHSPRSTEDNGRISRNSLFDEFMPEPGESFPFPRAFVAPSRNWDEILDPNQNGQAPPTGSVEQPQAPYPQPLTEPEIAEFARLAAERLAPLGNLFGGVAGDEMSPRDVARLQELQDKEAAYQKHWNAQFSAAIDAWPPREKTTSPDHRENENNDSSDTELEVDAQNHSHQLTTLDLTNHAFTPIRHPNGRTHLVVDIMRTAQRREQAEKAQKELQRARERSNKQFAHVKSKVYKQPNRVRSPVKQNDDD